MKDISHAVKNIKDITRHKNIGRFKEVWGKKLCRMERSGAEWGHGVESVL